jgi:UDP-N-acetylmuramate--alanine ligase
VIAACRAGLDRRVMVVFQPHRYSRTQQLMPEFATALAAADEVVVTDIYPAGEAPIPGVTVEALVEAIDAAATSPVHLVRGLEDLPARVAALARPGDLIVTMGAGSIGGVGDRILESIRASGGGEAGA